MDHRQVAEEEDVAVELNFDDAGSLNDARTMLQAGDERASRRTLATTVRELGQESPPSTGYRFRQRH